MALWSRDRDPVDRGRTMTIDDVYDQYDFVDFAGDDAIIVAERPSKPWLPSGPRKLAETPTHEKVDLRELGTTGETRYVEHNMNLVGYEGLEHYDKMKRSDAQVRASLRIIKTPVMAARWFVEPASESEQDQEIARFIEWNLWQGMSVSFPQLLTEILNFLDYGWYAFEKVFEIKDTPFGPHVCWQKFAPRHPLDAIQWVYDKQGGPKLLEMRNQNRRDGTVKIPIDKLVAFTFDKEGGNMEGVSVLRSAYKHWYFKESLYKIDAIQKERHGIGIPIIKLPPNFSAGDKLLANQMGKNLRTNEKAHVVLPPNWDILFAKLEGQRVDALESATHHGQMIYENVLGQFMIRVGDAASTSDTQEQMFQKGTRFIAEIVRDVFNKWAIPQLVAYNWEVEKPPELRVRRIGDTTDWRTISFAIRNFVGAGIIRPDERLENWVREEMDLPKPDPDTLREVATPQSPKVGPPRQSTAPGSQQGKRPEAEGRREDRSGG